ncbi:MAG: M20 family peptidase [Myxococcales bacterium]|nr:M20 family peptidase [Myxococcales bacterium]
MEHGPDGRRQPRPVGLLVAAGRLRHELAPPVVPGGHAPGRRRRSPSVKQRLIAAVDGQRERLGGVARAIHAHPELRFEERFAAGLLADELEAAGLTVTRGAHGLETALRAEIGPRTGPSVAILAEYDALPEIGHACGHNLIATGALGAMLALAKVEHDLPGRVVFLGTPAEEGGGGKIRLLEAGAFAGLDAAMMFHPFDRSVLWQGALAMQRVDFIFHGRPSHAAAAPWEGDSALRGVIQLFNLIDSARVHLRDGARIHGIITDGGQAVNIIPERASAAFSVRAEAASYLESVLMPMVLRCAEAAASATNTRVEIQLGQGYKDMRNNHPLARRFGEHLAALGVPFVEHDPTSGLGSTDMGDVSHAVPAIHPYLAICDTGAAMCHQHAFAEHAASDRGLAVAVAAAKAMALTAFDVISDGDLRSEAHRAFAP